MLDALVGRGVKLAVLSNKPDGFTRQCVTDLLPRWPFAAVIGSSPAFPTKPDPTSAREIARRLGAAPVEFLYLGDTSVDMQTAKAAGMVPVGALWGFRGREELLAGGASALIERPQELLRLL